MVQLFDLDLLMAMFLLALELPEDSYRWHRALNHQDIPLAVQHLKVEVR
jgi:hypothetical protein